MRNFPYGLRICWRARVAVSTSGRVTNRPRSRCRSQSNIWVFDAIFGKLSIVSLGESCTNIARTPDLSLAEFKSPPWCSEMTSGLTVGPGAKSALFGYPTPHVLDFYAPDLSHLACGYLGTQKDVSYDIIHSWLMFGVFRNTYGSNRTRKLHSG